jgi:hypothetical protein
VPWIALVAIYFVLRCALLSTMENSEPRYTLEMFPMLIACAACAFGPKGIAGGKLRAAAMDVGQVSRAESPT